MRTLLVVLAVAAAAPAHAQLAHQLPPVERDRDHTGPHHHGGGMHVSGGVGLVLQAASLTLDALPASYQTVAAHGHLHVGPLLATIHVPLHRLHRRYRDDVGFGDLMLEAGAMLRRGGVAAGGGLAISLPTGHEAARLGMGHVMLMPTAWAGLRRGAVDAILVASYHRALDADPDHEHGAHRAAVSPMSIEEVTGTARVVWWLAAEAGAIAQLGVAVPLVDDRTRAAAGAGARLHRGRLAVDAIVELGVAGEPFFARGVVEVHAAL